MVIKSQPFTHSQSTTTQKKQSTHEVFFSEFSLSPTNHHNNTNNAVVIIITVFIITPPLLLYLDCPKHKKSLINDNMYLRRTGIYYVATIMLRTTARSKWITNAFSTNRMTTTFVVKRFQQHQKALVVSTTTKLHIGSSCLSHSRYSNNAWLSKKSHYTTTQIHMSSTLNDSVKDDGGVYDSYDDDDNDIHLSQSNLADDRGEDGNNNNDNNNGSDEGNQVNELAQRLRSSLKKSKEKVTKKRNSLQKEFDKAKNLEATMKRANLIISNLYQLPPGTERALVQDWEQDGAEIELIFNTDKYNSPQEEADDLFATARKMKRGSKIVEKLLTKTQESLVILEDASLDLDAAIEDESDIDEGRLYIILDRLERTSSSTGFEMKGDSANKSKSANNRGKSKPVSTKYQPSFRRFLSPNGCIVLVGKNRRDNEAICFQVARGDDIWMHARGCPGAHVLLQVRRGSPRPTDDCMQFAANLAAFYSDARTERKAAVTTASPKHIQKPRGAPPGAVKLREELNTITGFPADVAEELKIAREESGVIWDESGKRSLGEKAKNKKRTKQVLQQNISKKRAEKRERKNRKADEGSDFW